MSDRPAGTVPFLSIVVPAYNESACIESSIRTIVAGLERFGCEWELIVSDDGSADDTAGRARAAAAGDRRVRVIEGAHLGKGGAVRAGMLAARGVWRFLTDADLSTPIDEVDRALGLTASAPRRRDVDIIIGSREGAGAVRLDEPWRRHALGRAFSWFVKATVMRGIDDTQCGFKGFRDYAAEALFRAQRIDGFGFDVEVLYLASRAGYRIEQMGVTWTYGRRTTVTLMSGLGGFLDVLRVRWNALRGVYGTMQRSGLLPTGLDEGHGRED